MEIREIKEGLKKPGKSRTGLAAAMGKLPSTITAMLKGEREIKAREVPIIRKYLGLDNAVPVVGRVGASDEIILFGEGDSAGEHVPAPENSTGETVAVEIDGDSLGPAFRGGLAFYNDTRSPVTSDLYRRLCVVATEEGARLIKILIPIRGSKHRFHLQSNHGGGMIENVKVEWAARVIDVRPKP
jgi:repressor LexA